MRQTVEAWETFWTSEQAQVVQPQHRPMAWRLFGMVDDQERAFRAYRNRPAVPGSTGQPATNPAFAEAMALEKSIVALEDRIRLNPKAMANLGIAVGQAKLTADEVNRMRREDVDELERGDDEQEIIEAEVLDQFDEEAQ